MQVLVEPDPVQVWLRGIDNERTRASYAQSLKRFPEDSIDYQVIDNVAVDADMISRIHELISAGVFSNVDEALRAAVKLLIVENAGAILGFHQRLALRLLADTIARPKT